MLYEKVYRNNIIDMGWIEDNIRYFKIRTIEEEIGCGKNVLQKYFRGERKLPSVVRESLDLFVANFIGSYAKEGYAVKRDMEHGVKDLEKEVGVIEADGEDISEKEIEDVVKEEVVMSDAGSIEDVFPYTIYYEKQSYKNMKRLRSNVNYNGETYEVFVYREGKFNYCYTPDEDRIDYIIEFLKK